MKRGVSIMFINGLVVAVVLLFSFGVDVTNRLVHQRYDQTVASQRALIACNNASKVFQQQSDEADASCQQLRGNGLDGCAACLFCHH